MNHAKNKSRWRTDFLATQVLDLSLPEFEFKTYDDILELREKVYDQLAAFRLKLSEASVRIQECEVDEVQSVAGDIAHNQIIPAINELEKKLRLSNDKFLLRIVKGVRSAKSSVPLVATVFTGLPVWLGVAFSAGATIGEAALETYFEKRDIRENNGFSFLLDIK